MAHSLCSSLNAIDVSNANGNTEVLASERKTPSSQPSPQRGDGEPELVRQCLKRFCGTVVCSHEETLPLPSGERAGVRKSESCEESSVEFLTNTRSEAGASGMCVPKLEFGNESQKGKRNHSLRQVTRLQTLPSPLWGEGRGEGESESCEESSIEMEFRSKGKPLIPTFSPEGRRRTWHSFLNRNPLIPTFSGCCSIMGRRRTGTRSSIGTPLIPAFSPEGRRRTWFLTFIPERSQCLSHHQAQPDLRLL